MARIKTVKDLTEIGSISADWVLKNLSFVGFLGFVAIIYIANAHYSEKKIRQIQAMEQDIRELRWKYMSLKSEVMYNSKQSEIAKDVEPNGLKSFSSRTKKIVVNN